MVLGVIWEGKAAAHYRAIDVMRAMERLGHDVVWPADDEGTPSARRLALCDVVHVFRLWDKQTQSMLSSLSARGTGIVWDTDDDLSKIPKEAPIYKESGGITGQRIHAETVKCARLADVLTVTTEALAERYRRVGIERIEVIPNQVGNTPKRKHRRHDGVVIGWIAGLEHTADAKRLKLSAILRRLLEQHPDVRVESVGVDLQLPERYRHETGVEFRHLPEHVGGYDIGLAPLADIGFNQTRSDIKVKEYAACAVPWLASPVGPYVGLGEDQGGRLVPDDGWFEALDRLLANPRERKKLARRAKSWAKRQRIDTEAKRWESAFLAAAAAASGRSAARATRVAS
jgi:glycosyltransferase involved in cell wall biosynthesis